jgi:RsiW-degrading membrane proteinase PrsW (M82 family)
MDQSYPVYQTEQQQTDWMSTLQLVFSLGILVCAILIAVAALIGNAVLVQNNLTQDLGVSASSMLVVIACSAFAVASVALISMICAARKSAGKPIPVWIQAKMLWLYGVIVVLPVLLLVGQNLFKIPKYANTWMPIFSVISIMVAGLWYMRIGIGRDWGKHPQRSAGLLTFSFGFTTVLILITEILVLAAFSLVFFLATAQDPVMLKYYQNLPNLLQGLQGDSQAAQQLIGELAAKPAIIFSAIIIIAFLMPLIEELLKTFGILLMKGRRLSPREGMLAGIVSGAGFGILEGMLFAVQTGMGIEPSAWIIFVVGRAAALVLHIFNGALNGYALARYWEDRKMVPLIGALLITLLVHGVWNLTAVLASLNILDQVISVVITILIFVLVLIGYIAFTRKDRNQTREMVISNGL